MCLGRRRWRQQRQEDIVDTIWGYISLKQAALDTVHTNIEQVVMDEGTSKGQRALDNLQEHWTTK